MTQTVVVLSYNHPEITARAVRSAIELNPEQVLLVHNGSLPQHVADLQNRFPDVRHLILKTNRGYSGGANAGLRAAFAKTDWAILLTNDSILENLPTIPREPCLAAPLIFRKGKDRLDSAGGLFIPSQGKLIHCRSPEEFHSADGERVFHYVPGTCFLIHRQVFEAAGGLNEAYGIYWDDVEFSRNAVERGYSLRLLEDWRVRHFIGKTAHHDSLYTLYHYQRNRRRLSWKYTPTEKRAILAVRLAGDWSRLGLRLLRQGRISDLSYFPGIMLD